MQRLISQEMVRHYLPLEIEILRRKIFQRDVPKNDLLRGIELHYDVAASFLNLKVIEPCTLVEVPKTENILVSPQGIEINNPVDAVSGRENEKVTAASTS